MNVEIPSRSLSWKYQGIGPHPDFNRQPRTTRWLTEHRLIPVTWISDFDVIPGIGTFAPDCRVQVLHDRPRLSESWIAIVCSMVTEARSIDGGRAYGFPKPPIPDRPFRQD